MTGAVAIKDAAGLLVFTCHTASFNATRADRTIEARLAPGGKDY